MNGNTDAYTEISNTFLLWWLFLKMQIVKWSKSESVKNKIAVCTFWACSLNDINSIIDIFLRFFYAFTFKYFFVTSSFVLNIKIAWKITWKSKSQACSQGEGQISLNTHTHTQATQTNTQTHINASIYLLHRVLPNMKEDKSTLVYITDCEGEFSNEILTHC